jgi:hypothetical protein
MFSICILICNILVLDLYFLLIDILDLYLDLLILYQKVQNLFLFFEKIKTCPKTGPKPKLKNSFQITGYNIITANQRL